MAKKQDRSEYLKNYFKEKTDVIRIRVQKPTGAAIRKAAADSKESVQGYIVRAVHSRMKQEGKPLELEEDNEPKEPAQK